MDFEEWNNIGEKFENSILCKISGITINIYRTTQQLKKKKVVLDGCFP